MCLPHFSTVQPAHTLQFIHLWAFKLIATSPHPQMQNMLVCLTVALQMRDSIRLPRDLAGALSCIIDWAQGWSRWGTTHLFPCCCCLWSVQSPPIILSLHHIHANIHTRTHTHSFQSSRGDEREPCYRISHTELWFVWMSVHKYKCGVPMCVNLPGQSEPKKSKFWFCLMMYYNLIDEYLCVS